MELTPLRIGGHAERDEVIATEQVECFLAR
jgi:hypothetical protein